MIPSTSNVGENCATEGVPAWKQELNERLAATRSRRLRIQGEHIQGEHIQGEQVPLPGMEPPRDKVPSRASRLAAKVAQRYANAPSYSEVLTNHARVRIEPAPAAELPPPRIVPELRYVEAESQPAMVVADDVPVVAEAEEEQVVEPLAVNLVEVPRELVAARKARPRLAEGPLRAEPANVDQLKIFEVAPETISQKVKIGAAATDWTPIRLDTNLVPKEEPKAQQIPLNTATIEDRVMAGIFDLALVVAAFALFVLVFVACTAHPPTGRPAIIAAALALGCFFVLYQYLFFKFAEGTPGMRYAKIALCTFEDENPTRQAMCRRVFFLLLSAAPLGLGFLWACFDPDRLGWHDRMSRIYQRSYS